MGGADEEPKSLRKVAGRPILFHALEALEARGMHRLTLIVGYERQRLMEAVGPARGGLRIEYVVNEDYDTTEHGWSLYMARDAWRQGHAPVLFMDADNVFDPDLLDRLLAAPEGNVVLVDPTFDTSRQEDELVLGSDGHVTGFVRGHAHAFNDCVGAFVGINRFTPEFMQTLFDFMDDFFAVHGRRYKYERVFHRLLDGTGAMMRYLDTAGLDWVNVNHHAELNRAERILEAVTRSRAPATPRAPLNPESQIS